MLLHLFEHDEYSPTGRSDQLVGDLTSHRFVGRNEQVDRAAIEVRVWWGIAYGSTPPYVKSSATLPPRSSKRALADRQPVLPRRPHTSSNTLHR